jgi:anionic cell wall polymer biosynthesis LytR-Cps2A-Psr (LCP) family protein
MFLLSACIFVPVDVVVTQTMDAIRSQTPPPTSTFYQYEAERTQLASTPEPSPTYTYEPPERTNWLILGGDYRSHRQGTRYGDKTDVIILISVLQGYVDPYQVTMIQYPRNLYIPIEAMDDQWLFAVYGREGFPGLHYYWQQAFDIDLAGIFYINMDGFVKLIDDLGDLPGHPGKDGEAVLAYLRDNNNNWERGKYDAERRSLGIAYALAQKVADEITENPFATVKILFDRWHGLIRTDVVDAGQLAYLAYMGWEAKDNYTIEFVQLEEPDIVRGETPLEVRGMIPATDLSEWHRDILEVR